MLLGSDNAYRTVHAVKTMTDAIECNATEEGAKEGKTEKRKKQNRKRKKNERDYLINFYHQSLL